MPNRRQLLKGALATSFVATSGIAVWQLSLQDEHQLVTSDPYNYHYLTEEHRLVLMAIIPVVLQGALDEKYKQDIKLKLMAKLDQAIGFLSESSWNELEELLSLLANQLGRSFLAGVWQSWNQASAEVLNKFLMDWRNSYFKILRSGYFGLHQLILGTYYALPESWEAIGYAGPPKLNLDDNFYSKFDL